MTSPGPAANDNSDALPGLDYTVPGLEKAVLEARAFQKQFIATTTVIPHAGLKTTATLDWAPKLVRRCGVPQAIIEKIGAVAFAKRRPEDNAAHLAHVERRFAAQQPLVFRIAVGPLKNIRQCGSAQLPDLAEYLGFVQLSRVMYAVAAIYPHGVQVEMVPDDKRAFAANRCPAAYVSSYIQGLQQLAEQLGYHGWLHVMNGQEALYKEYNTQSFWTAAEEKITLWQQAHPESFAIRWQVACENAEKNFNVELMTPTQKEVHAAAWRYLVAHQSEILSGMWSTDHIFPLMYANHPNNYQLFTMAAKQTKLPWQIGLPKSLLANHELKIAI